VSFGRHYGVLVAGLVLALAGLVMLGVRDYLDVTVVPEYTFVPLKSIALALAITLAGEVALSLGVVLIAIWIGVRLRRRTLGHPWGLVILCGILVASIALAITGAVLANSDRGEFLPGGPAHGIDFVFLAFILEHQLFQLMLVSGIALLAGWVARLVSRRRLL
jgi:hypothetical protein